MTDLSGAILGDEVLVDGAAYGVGVEWARLSSVSPGSAAVYPYKVLLSNGATGQYKAEEVRAWRRPVDLHQILVEIEADHPGYRRRLVENARTPR